VLTFDSQSARPAMVCYIPLGALGWIKAPYAHPHACPAQAKSEQNFCVEGDLAGQNAS
jgi:hypothetical protein